MSDFFFTYYKKYGNKILFRYKKNDEPQTKQKVIDFYQPKLWLNSEQTTDTTDIYGNYVKAVEFDSMKEAKNFGDQYKDVDNFEINGNADYANQFIIELFDGKEPDYNPDLVRIGLTDIEVDAPEFPHPAEAKWPVNAITTYDSVEKRFYALFLTNGNGQWSQENSPSYIKELAITAFHFETEEDLLRAFLSHVNDHSYDIISGWNSEGFDIPYIVNRCNQLFGEAYTRKMLSPFGMINSREVKTKGNFGKKQEKFEIVGLPHLDYMQLYKKHTYMPRESYKLDFIAYAELGENKISYEQASSLHDLYRKDFQTFCDYNIHDTNLMKRLEEKLGLFSLVYAMSYYSLSNFEDTMGTVKIWEQLVAKFLFNKNKVPPFRHLKKEERDFEGAFVKDPVPGYYDWIVSYDLNSLYPHCEMQYNIGMDTHIPNPELPEKLKQIRENYTFDDLLHKRIDTSPLKEYDVVMAPNFEFYRKDKMSFFSEIKRELYSQRKKVKKDMIQAEKDQQKTTDKTKLKELEDLEAKLNNMQLGLKVLLNGGYGALASPYFLYYMVENAEAITMSGQLVNKWVSSATENYLKELFQTDKLLWAAGDTDSFYMSIGPFIDTIKETDIQKKVDIADQFCNEIMKPFIDDQCDELCDYVNGYEQKMVWEREVIADAAIWVAKKKYVMQVRDSEGVRFKEPKIKITGVEAVKSSFPEWSRNLLKECYKIALQGKESDLHERIETIRSEFEDYDVNTIAIPSGINGIMKYYDETNLYKSGTPKHVKAALNHNKMIDELGIKRLQKISDGDKIKYVQLKLPNPTGQETIGFDSYLPKEFGIEEYIDKDAIFEKSFMSPLNIFLKSIGWKSEYVNTLF